MHYYHHNIADYRKDTHHLSLLEHGIYRQLLDTYYLDEKPLCADIAKLMRSHNVRSADEVQAFNNVLSDFFLLTDEGYRHSRCDREIALIYAKSEKARQSAKARWSAKTEQKQEVAQCDTKEDANALRTECEGNATQDPIPNTKESNTARKRAPLRTLKTWMEEVKQAGEKMIPAEDTIFTDGIPKPFLHLAWKVFAEEMIAKSKKQRDWRAHFRTYVRNDYLRLWAMNRERQYYLTTAGKQAAIRFDMKELMDE